jgi:hypothetical protein
MPAKSRKVIKKPPLECSYCHKPLEPRHWAQQATQDPLHEFCSRSCFYHSYLREGPHDEFEEETIFPCLEQAGIPEDQQVEILEALDAFLLLAIPARDLMVHWCDQFFHYIVRWHHIQELQHILIVILSKVPLLWGKLGAVIHGIPEIAEGGSYGAQEI